MTFRLRRYQLASMSSVRYYMRTALPVLIILEERRRKRHPSLNLVGWYSGPYRSAAFQLPLTLIDNAAIAFEYLIGLELSSGEAAAGLPEVARRSVGEFARGGRIFRGQHRKVLRASHPGTPPTSSFFDDEGYVQVWPVVTTKPEEPDVLHSADSSAFQASNGEVYGFCSGEHLVDADDSTMTKALFHTALVVASRSWHEGMRISDTCVRPSELERLGADRRDAAPVKLAGESVGILRDSFVLTGEG